MQTVKACTLFAKGLHMPAWIINERTSLLVIVRLRGLQQNATLLQRIQTVSLHIYIQTPSCVSGENSWDFMGMNFHHLGGWCWVPPCHQEHSGEGMKYWSLRLKNEPHRGFLDLLFLQHPVQSDIMSSWTDLNAETEQKQSVLMLMDHFSPFSLPVHQIGKVALCFYSPSGVSSGGAHPVLE